MLHIFAQNQEICIVMENNYALGGHRHYLVSLGRMEIVRNKSIDGQIKAPIMNKKVEFENHKH